MNVTRKDLDNEILEKLDRLDSIVENFGNVPTDGFISYNNEKGFYFKKTNDSMLRKVISEDEIITLRNHINEPESNEYTTNSGIQILDDSFNYATQKMKHKILPVLNIPSISKSAIRKYINNRYFAYFKMSGEFILADMKNNFNIIYHNQILSKIQETFNLSKDIKIFNISDFVFLTSEVILVATDVFGTYKYNLKTDEAEILFNAESKVRCIEISHTNKIFVACDDFCAFYNLEGELIEKMYNVRDAGQIPTKIFKTSTDIFVLGKALGVNQLDCLLHGWTLDEAEVGYNCIDKNIMPNPTDNYNNIFSTQLNDDYLLLYVKYYDYVYAWKYDLDTLEMESILLSDDAKNVLDVLFVGTSFVISKRNELEIISNIESTLTIDKNLVNLIPYESGILGFNEDYTSAASYEIKDFTRHIEDITFRCELPETSNNIDILVANGVNLQVKFYNKEGRAIQPTFVAKYKNDSVYKFINCPEKDFDIVVHVDENTILDGIIVKSNKMFLR